MGAVAGAVLLAAAAVGVVSLVTSRGGAPSNPAGQMSGAEIRLPIGPDRLAVSGSSVWALQTGGGALALVDARTRRVRSVPEPYDLGGGARPAIAADARAAWVASSAASVGGVDRVPEAAGGAGALHVPLPQASAVAVGHQAIFATSNPGASKDGSIVRIDPQTGDITARGIVGRGPADIAIAAGDVWVSLRRSGEVARVDPGTLHVLKRIKLQVGISELAADGNTLWVLNTGNRTVSRIDARTGTSVGVPLTLGKELQAIAAGGGALWIAASDRTVTRMNAGGVVIGTPIPVGGLPLFLASQGSAVWVASGSDNSLALIAAH